MRRKMWFGTEEWMQWIDVPNSGADVSPKGQGAAGVLLGGGGFVMPARGSHKTYNFSWGEAAAISAAELMQAYASGAYGDGLIYLHEPHTLRTNILPAQWAQPSLALEYDAPSLIPGVRPTALATAGWQANRLPVKSARYAITAAANDTSRSLFIPIAPGYSLRVGAFYQYTGTGGVFVAPVNAAGEMGASTQIAGAAYDSAQITPTTITPGTIGVRVWVGRTSTATSTVTLAGLVARLLPTITPVTPAMIAGPWVPGQGNSGCRIEDRPTRIAISGVNGGQVGYSAVLREVGSWEH